MPPCPLSGVLAAALGYVPGDHHLPPSCEAVSLKAEELYGELFDSGNAVKAMAVCSMLAHYSGWWANRARILAERETREANKRARRAEADCDERLAVAAQRRRLPLIAELNDHEFEEFVAATGLEIEANYPRVVAEVNGLLPHGWRELLRVVCEAHREQVYPDQTAFRDRRVKRVDVQIVCGDFQRGKSTVEALYGLINHAIHNSARVGDVCCTFVVTQMRAWALALKDTIETKTARSSPLPGAAPAPNPAVVELDDDELDPDALLNEEGGVAIDDLAQLPIARFGGRSGREAVKNALERGGTALTFRTGPQFESHSKMIAEINDKKTHSEKALVYTLVLDEADKFFGDRRADHARQLLWMCGFDGRAQPNKPVLVACVSATNCGPCYYFMRRMHLMLRAQLVLRLADIVSFKPPAALTYKTATQPVLPAGEVMEIPRPDGEYVTPQILDMWVDAFSRPHSVLLDTATVRVNYGVDHNMLDHVEELEVQMEQRRMLIPEAERPAPKPGVIVYLHGGHTTHLGMIGLQFINEEYLPEAEYAMSKLERAMHAASASEAALADQLTHDGGDAYAITEARQLAEKLRHCGNNLDTNYNERTQCLEAHYLTEFAWWIRTKAVRLGHYTEQQLQGLLDPPPPSYDRDHGNGKSPWSTKSLQLMLFIVRKFIGDLPIVVVGGAMVRRSMSIVCVDFFRPKISVELDGEAYAGVYVGQPWALAVITHALHTRFANSADGAQAKCRDRTTLTGWDVAHPDLAAVRDLVIEDLSAATLGFTAFNAMPELQRPLAARQAMLQAIYTATRAPNLATEIERFRNTMLTTDDQVRWFDDTCSQVEDAADLNDSLSDANHFLGLACALASRIHLPVPTRELFQRQRNPMFQRGSGVQERDEGNIHANLSSILHSHEPLQFRHALTSSRRRGGGNAGGPLGGVMLMCAQWLLDNGFVADEEGNPPLAAPETWTIFWGLRAQYPHLIGRDGYKELNVTSRGGAGCGFAMSHLVKRDICDKMSEQRLKPNPPPNNGVPPNPPNPRARNVQVYWLKRGVALPAISADVVNPPLAAPLALPAPAQA